MKRSATGRTIIAFALMAIATFPIPLTAQESARVVVSGDARLGYFNLHRDERSGEVTTSDALRARLRAGAGLRVAPSIDAKIRVAGRFATDQTAMSFFVRDHTPGVDGLGLGDVTVDEAYLDIHPSSAWSVRVGRMQTKSVLADLQGKSLIRGDSPNIDVTWTDGARLALALGQGWNSQLVLQHNASSGPTNVMRPPLAFSDSRSRITVFGGVENTTKWGPVVQRGLDLTYIGSALHTGAEANGDTRDYLGVVARGSLAWPLSPPGSRISLGGELGYAPNTPSRLEMKLGDAGSGHVGGTAFQVALTLADLVPLHRVGLVYGETEAGWLLSPDFRNNDRLIEGRYQWAFHPRHSFEARLRQRRDLERPIGASQKREDLDFYLRISSRF
jgi:hypothetical protein